MNKEILNNVVKYLNSARVLISSNDMEEIINERDINYGDEDKVDECINYIKGLINE